MNDRPRRSSLASSPQPTSGRSARRVATTQSGRRHKPDYWLLVLAALLVTVGLVVVYSISPGLAASQKISQGYFITKHLLAVGVGLIAFALASMIPISTWKKTVRPLAIAAIIGCIVVLITPVDAAHQAHRWIRAGGMSFQVAELIKLAILIGVASFLATRWQERKIGEYNATIKPLLILLLGVGFVMAILQSDLGSAGVIIAMVTIMAYSAGIPLGRIGLIVAIILALVVVSIASASYRRDRLTAYLNPQANCEGSGYQACQALVSVGSGGILGLGLGYSVQAYGYLPEAANDSIFAIIAEKFGFIGSVSIVVLYAVFITRVKQLIERTSDQFNRLILVGFLAWFSTQMIINIGAMIGLLPLKGITLPLISQGGTSLIFLAVALGIVFQISRYTNYNVVEPENSPGADSRNSFNGRGIRRPHNPSLVARPRA